MQLLKRYLKPFRVSYTIGTSSLITSCVTIPVLASLKRSRLFSASINFPFNTKFIAFNTIF